MCLDSAGESSLRLYYFLEVLLEAKLTALKYRFPVPYEGKDCVRVRVFHVCAIL